MKKLLIILLLGLFFISFASAAEWDNGLRYEDNNMKVTIENWAWVPFFGDDLGTAELKSHKSVNQVLHVAPGSNQVVMYYDFNFNEIYDNGLGDVEFINMTDGENIEKDYHFVIWDTITEEKNNYSTVCNKMGNGTISCEQVFKGTYIEEKEGWITLDKKDIPKGRVRIGLSTNVNLGETIDGVWTIAGKKIKKHAVWTADLNVGLVSYWKFDNNNLNDSLNLNNGTNNGTINGTGIIEDGRNFNSDIDFMNMTNGSTLDLIDDISFSVWIKPTTAQTGALIGRGTGTDQYFIYYDGITDDIFAFFGGSTVQTSTSPIIKNEWNHVVVTYMDSNNNATIYVNGTEIISSIVGELVSHPASKTIIGVDPRDLDGFNYRGEYDEAGIWNRTLNLSSVIQLYNNGLAITWTDDFTVANINITLNSPNNNSATENNTIVFNVSINATFLEVVNVSLLIDGVVNETNISGVEGNYIFQKDLSFANHNWSIRVGDNESNITNSVTRDLFILNETGAQVWTDEYQVRLIAFNLTESDFEINNLVITQEDDNLWKINTTESDYEVARAQVVKTFFYGTNGTDPRINRTTGLLRIQSVASKDSGKRGTHVSLGDLLESGTITYTGTFSDTSNNTNCSSWSRVAAHKPSSLTTGGSNEIGTDTSGDEIDNPLDSQVQGTHNGAGGQSSFSRWEIPSGGTKNNFNSAGTTAEPDSSFGADIITFCSGNITWVNSGWGSDNVIDFTINESIPEMSPVPNITLNSPIDDFKELPDTNITFNVTSTITGSTLSEAKLFINDTLNETISISGTEDTETFTKSFALGNYNWSVEICDISDNCALSETRNFEINLFKINSQTFNNVTSEGSTEIFIINISVSELPTSANLIYNGTSTASDLDTSNFPIIIISESIIVPTVSINTNFSFLWNIVFPSDTVNTSSLNQTVNLLTLDNCSSFTNVLFNYTMVDEASQQELNGSGDNVSLEVDISIFSSDRSLQIINFSTEFNGTNPNAICSETNLLNISTFILDSIVKYSSSGRAIEYYNIRDFEIDNTTTTQNITLFDIKTSESTDFQITFKDSSFVVVEGGLIQVNRQYVSEGVFKTVELPITDSNGQTVVHLVKNDVVYNYIVIKDNEIIGTFNNLIAFCEDETIGQCFIALNAIQGTTETFNPDQEIGIDSSFSFNDTSRDLTLSFSTNDGSVKTILLSAIKMDQLGNESVCSISITSASGTLVCNIAASIGNETIITSIFVDNELKLTSYFSADNDIQLGPGGFFLLLFLVISTALMFSESKSMTIVGVALGFIAGNLLFFTQGGIIATGSAVIWIIVMGIILIWKLQSEGQT